MFYSRVPKAQAWGGPSAGPVCYNMKEPSAPPVKAHCGAVSNSGP